MRTNWSAQSERLWAHFNSKPNQDIPAPELNRAAAGDGGQYVASLSKRISECRSKARSLGYDLLKSRDEWVGGCRHTWYKLYIP